MARPTKGYFVDGKRVPGVTTILSRFKDSGGLIHWAWQMGMDGKDYREERDKAAGIGNIAHDMVEAHIKGEQSLQYLDGVPKDMGDKAMQSYEAFVTWATDSQLEVEATEFPLVSENYKFGGTGDVMFVKGKRSLGDWKTSNSVYPEYIVQLAAYKALWEENYPNQPIEGGGHLIRFDKEYGDFHHHYWTDLDDAWEAFKHMRELYELMKTLKRRAS